MVPATGPHGPRRRGDGGVGGPHVTVAPLAPAEVPRLYPLVQLACPDMSIERWRAYAEDQLGTPDAIDGRRGILAARGPCGDLLGFCSYVLQADLRDGSALEASDLFAVDMAGGEGVLAAMLETLHGLARGSGCGCLRIAVPGSSTRLRATGDRLVLRLQAAGLAVDCISLSKKLGARGSSGPRTGGR